MSIAKEDDFMFQENYVVEFTEEVAEQIRALENFTFDFVFDHTGMAGIFHSQQIKKELLFRVFNLPLPTEVYTSSDGAFYYKNSDLTQIIYVYEPGRPPQIFRDYQEFMLAQASLAMREHPFQYDVQPHGLTPPARFAPFNLYPQVPIRPRFMEYPDGPELTLVIDKQRPEKIGNKIAVTETKLEKLRQDLEKQIQNAQRAGETTNKRIENIQQQIVEAEEQLERQQQEESHDQQQEETEWVK